MDAVVTMSTYKGLSQKMMGNHRRPHLRRKRLNTELLVAVERGDRDEAARLLDNDANPNATCCPGEVSAVHVAALAGHTDLLRLLLDRGAEPDRGDASSRTAVHLAAWAGHAPCVQLLVERRPGMIGDRVGSERLECDAIPQEWQDSRRHDHVGLLAKLPALEAGSSPLHVACQVASLACIQVLLDAGASLTATDDCCMTPLDVVGERLVVDRYKEAKVASEALETPEVATRGVEALKNKAGVPRHEDNGSLTRCIETLLQRGAVATTEIKAMGTFRETVMHTAVELESLDAITALAAAGYAALFWDKHGATPTHIAVARRLEQPLKVLLQACTSEDRPVVDVVDIKGYTPLHKAVIGEWAAGVNVLLEVGADIDAKTPQGETVLHLAAEKGNTDILAELLKIPDDESAEPSVTPKRTSLDEPNNKGETPLFRAIFGGNIECVRMLLAVKADVSVKMAYEFTVLHRAIELDQPAILDLLLQQFEVNEHPLIEAMDTQRSLGMTPLLLAADKGYAECVKTLLKFGGNPRARVAESHTNARACTGETALHLASAGGYDGVVALLLEHDARLLGEKDEAGWRAIHVAAHRGHRETVRVMIARGAELSARCTLRDKSERTAMELIMANITRPVGFLEEAFDACITNNKLPINDVESEVVLDFSILFPRGEDSNQLKVIDALSMTGNRHGQHTLFLHPLIASFLLLKWRKLSAFFYGLITLYLVFVFSFTMLCVMMYYYQDTDQELPSALNIDACRSVVITFTSLLLLLELASVIQVPLMYLTDVETWIKLVSFVLTLVVCAEAAPANDAVWLRHVTTLALLLAWMQFLFLISRVPRFGYYILMFARVTGNVIGVLLAFLFLMFGFALTFMIQFRAQPPFTDPWNAFAKTFLMMTGEYDYSGLFEFGSEGSQMLFAQIIFLVFVIFIGISLMNLLVGMAVSDIADLEVKGTISRIKKQAEFLSMLEVVVFSTFFFRCLPKRLALRLNRRRQVATTVKLNPGMPRKQFNKVLPSSVVESILVRISQSYQLEGDPTLTDIYRSLQALSTTVDFATGARLRPSDHSDSTDLDRPRVADLAARVDALGGEVKTLRKAVERAQRASLQR